jgi:hypothetical protein
MQHRPASPPIRALTAGILLCLGADLAEAQSAARVAVAWHPRETPPTLVAGPLFVGNTSRQASLAPADTIPDTRRGVRHTHFARYLGSGIAVGAAVGLVVGIVDVNDIGWGDSSSERGDDYLLILGSTEAGAVLGMDAGILTYLGVRLHRHFDRGRGFPGA